ncbi:MAG: hypothetical protein HUU57_01070 [Bdellovibrio sp.]|nr:hypothetical protein [Bdellovibrio sp.]
MNQKFIKGAVIVSAVAIISVFFQNCGVGSFTASSVEGVGSKSSVVDTTTDDDSTPSEKSDFSSFQFFYGGWYPAPNQPNWSDDINFTLKDGVLTADSKTSDELCTKPTYTVSDADRKAILELIAGLTLVVAKDIPPIADVGAKTIRLKLNNGSEKLIHLQATGAQNGDNVATNGAELGNFLQELNKKIPLACKNVESEDLISFTYFYGGGYLAPGMPSWFNDIEFRVTSSGVIVKSKVHDSPCLKPDFKLSGADANLILMAAIGLDIKTKPAGPIIADAPTNKVTLTYSSGETKVVHLSDSSAAVGDLLATNGADFARLLQELDKTIPMACH